MTNYLMKCYSFNFTVIERANADNKNAIRDLGQNAFAVSNYPKIISVDITDTATEYYTRGRLFYSSDNIDEIVIDEPSHFIDFKKDEYAVYCKKVIRQDVIYKLPLPEGMSLDEAIGTIDEQGVLSVVALCGEPVFDSYGYGTYYPDNDEVWSTRKFAEKVFPVKDTYLKAIEYAMEKAADGTMWDD